MAHQGFASRVKTRQRNRIKHREKNLCRDCHRKAEVGKSLCTYHRLYYKKKREEYKSAKSQTQLSNESCPNGEFNMGLEVQKSKISSPKLSPTEITSPNPNIKSNSEFCSQALLNNLK